MWLSCQGVCPLIIKKYWLECAFHAGKMDPPACSHVYYAWVLIPSESTFSAYSKGSDSVTSWNQPSAQHCILRPHLPRDCGGSASWTPIINITDTFDARGWNVSPLPCSWSSYAYVTPQLFSHVLKIKAHSLYSIRVFRRAGKVMEFPFNLSFSSNVNLQVFFFSDLPEDPF